MQPESPSPSSSTDAIDESTSSSTVSLESLQQQAQKLQADLSQALDNATAVRDECSRLKSENVFLQEYIGNLLSTGNLINK